nr:MAG TPA: hypothetical protein [Bacteriophage sp.]
MSFTVGFATSFPTVHTNLYLPRVLPLLGLHPHYWLVVQWVERLTVNQVVVGSSPTKSACRNKI